MLKFNSKVLAVALAAAGMVSATGGAMAATTSGNLVVSATLAAGCEVSTGGAISFGSIVALASTADKTADSGTTFQVACSSGVSPTISSATARSMTNGGATPKLLPFNLSMTAGAAADDLPVSGTTQALSFTKDGTLQTVTVYGRVVASNFSGTNVLPLGSYTNTMVMDVAY
jgi:spore coat protein U-like protein